MDAFGRAIAIAAVSTAGFAIFIVWLLTDGEWYWQSLAGLLVWAVCWIAMGITSGFADDE